MGENLEGTELMARCLYQPRISTRVVMVFICISIINMQTIKEGRLNGELEISLRVARPCRGINQCNPASSPSYFKLRPFILISCWLQCKYTQTHVSIHAATKTQGSNNNNESLATLSDIQVPHLGDPLS